MYKAALLIAVVHFVFGLPAFSQITINLPKMPKIEKPKTDPGKNVDGASGNRTKSGDGNNLYSATEPAIAKDSVQIRAFMVRSYRKNYSRRSLRTR